MSEVFSKGDVVTIRATVEFIHNHTGEIAVSIRPDGYYQNIHVGPEFLTLVHRYFDIGERVWSADADAYGFVRAINGEMAWIERENLGSYLTIALKDIERAPLPEQSEAA